MKKQSINIVIKNNLKSKIAYGERKHQAKIAQGVSFGASTYKIYSFTTYSTYERECLNFGEWVKTEKGINSIKSVDDIEPYAKEYLQTKLDKGCSVWTVKTEKSALGMLLNKQIEIDIPKRDTHNITRSRKEPNCRYSRDGQYKDIFTLALATGGRECDILKLTPDSFVYRDGKLYADIRQSKGGRDRLSYVREEYAEEVLKIAEKAKLEGKKYIIDHVPVNLDVHALRREYAYELYQDIQKDDELRTFLLNHEPPRKEYRISVNKDGIKVTKEIQRDTYKDREGNIFKREDVYLISRMLGHNRIDTAIVHYLHK